MCFISLNRYKHHGLKEQIVKSKTRRASSAYGRVDPGHVWSGWTQTHKRDTLVLEKMVL